MASRVRRAGRHPRRRLRRHRACSTGSSRTAWRSLSADAAGIMLADPRGRLRVVASSNEESDWTELLAAPGRRGPLRGLRPHRTTGRRHRPRRAPPTAGRGSPQPLAGQGSYRSVHALPLRLRGQAIGGLNLFHTRPGPLPEADLRLGQALADIATIGILQERAIRHGEVVTEQLADRAEQPRSSSNRPRACSPSTGSSPWTTAFDRLRRSRPRPQPAACVEVARRVVGERNTAHQVLGSRR